MKRGTWKAIERQWAERLDGKRVPITGRTRGDAPDVAHERWSIEVKAGRVMSMRLQEAVEQADASCKEGQTPIVCITQTEGRGKPNENFVLMRFDDWNKLVQGDSHAKE